MVFLRSVKANGLYSYDATSKDASLDNVALLSKSMVIVGPNDSGKSNLFRMLELFVQSLMGSRRLEKYEVFPNVIQPSLLVKFAISEKEAILILDFLSFYRDKLSNPQIDKLAHYEFKNKLSLARLLQDVSCEITWHLSNNYQMEPMFEIAFEKIGLKFMSYLNYANVVVGTRVDPQTTRQANKQILRSKFLEFIDEIAAKDETIVKSQIDEFFNVPSLTELWIENLSSNYAQFLSEDEMRTLIALYNSLGRNSPQTPDISFLHVFGTILSEKIFFTTGGRILGSSQSRIVGDSFAQGYMGPSPRAEKIVLNLKPNGSNLAQFLFDLHVSTDPKYRAKFSLIQSQFSKVLNGRLTFDVVQESERRSISSGVNLDQPIEQLIEHQKIVVVNQDLEEQFSLDGVGYGISELLFLLSVCIGVDDSVLLLDEPSGNMHPPLMKQLMKQLGEGNNQIIMITHSPELAHYEIFGKGADLVYVRKDAKSSSIKCLSNGEKMLGLNRSSLYSEIDGRIFFGRSIILCEGYADELFLEDMARSLKLDLDGNGAMIVSTRGMGDFNKYSLLMNYFGIKYVIMADTDATSDWLLDRKANKYANSENTKFAIIGDKVEGKPRIFFIKGNLEKLLMELDPVAYQKAATEVAKNDGKKDSKPLITQEYLEKQVSQEKKHAVALLLKPIFDTAISS